MTDLFSTQIGSSQLGRVFHQIRTELILFLDTVGFGAHLPAQDVVPVQKAAPEGAAFPNYKTTRYMLRKSYSAPIATSSSRSLSTERMSRQVAVQNTGLVMQ